MPVRNESELLYSRHSYFPIETVVVGPGVSKSLPQNPYDSWIISTSAGEFKLDHYSQFEPGHAGHPMRMSLGFVDRRGRESHKVIGEFQRRNSSKKDYHEYELVSGQNLSKLDRSGMQPEDLQRGIVGRVWAKEDEDVWRYMAHVLTGNVEYQDPLNRATADKSVKAFLENELMQFGGINNTGDRQAPSEQIA